MSLPATVDFAKPIMIACSQSQCDDACRNTVTDFAPAGATEVSEFALVTEEKV